MTKKVVYVRGVGSHNGGAEILLRASKEHIGDRAKVSRALRQRWSIGGYLSVPRFGRFESLGVDVLPKQMAARLQIYSGRHADAVLDASGFAIGDQWSSDSINRDAATFARLRRRNVPIVLLPQAFGPFEKPEVRLAALALFKHVDLICARDDESFEFVAQLRGTTQNMMLAPDITIALDAHPHSNAGSERRIAVVPNVNLSVRSLDPNALAKYAASLHTMCELLIAAGYLPFLLVHSSHGDPQVAEAVTRLGGNISVITPRDGLEAKSIIGACSGVIAGRYHAIVSALSQGVPAVAHSWSHKYGALLSDFGVDRGLADPFDPRASVDELLLIMDSDDYGRSIRESKPELVEAVSNVWTAVDQLLFERGASA
jgi:polysaccharide pyruvyl transferase WcaK-like protein